MAPTLPPEILLMIVSLVDTYDLKDLRRTSREIGAPATQLLFRSVFVFNTDRSCNAVESIMKHPYLKGLVRRIYFCTVESNTHLSEADECEKKELPEKWRGLFAMLKTLPNLDAIILRYDNVCATDLEISKYAVQSKEWRDTLMEWLLSEVVELPRPLKELAIQNYQNTTQLGVHGDAILGKLMSLRLNVVHDTDDPIISERIEKSRHRKFYNRLLPSVWLKPAMSSLRSLVLYSDQPWGGYPGVPLKGIHFPNLQTLTLGNYCFFEDAQLDWIISHSSTLQELYLDTCVILFEFDVCEENLPDPSTIPGSIMEGDAEEGHAFFCTYPRRWYDYFASLESGLPKLRHFAIGRSDWAYSMPFEQEQEIRPCLMLERYMSLDQFIDEDDRPNCDEQDHKALKQLYRKIGQKVDPRAFQDPCCWGADLFEVSPLDWPGGNGLYSPWIPVMDERGLVTLWPPTV